MLWTKKKPTGASCELFKEVALNEGAPFGIEKLRRLALLSNSESSFHTKLPSLPFGQPSFDRKLFESGLCSRKAVYVCLALFIA